MNDKFYLQLNFWNLITVNLMVVIGFIAVTAIVAAFNSGDTADA